MVRHPLKDLDGEMRITLTLKVLKNSVCIIACFVISTFATTCTTKEERSQIASMKVAYVDLDIMTPMQVTCEKFESSFRSSISHTVLTADRQQELLNEIDRIIRYGKEYKQSADVRMTIGVLNKSSQIISNYCVGYNLLSYNGHNYALDDDFRSTLETFIYKEK